MLSGFYALAPVRGLPWYGFEALNLAAATIAAVLRFLLRLALFGGVDEVVDGTSQLQGSPAVGEPEPECRRREHGQDAEKEERALHPGEHEQCGQRGPKDAGEREVLTALVGEVGRQVGLASLFAQTLDPQFDQPGLEQCRVPREVQRPSHDPELVPGVPQRADLGLAPELETLLKAQQPFKILAGTLGRALYPPHRSQTGRSVELAGERAWFRCPLRSHVPHRPADVLFRDTGRSSHLYEDFGRDRRGVGRIPRPPARVQF